MRSKRGGRVTPSGGGTSVIERLTSKSNVPPPEHPVVAGHITPMRDVPADIARPDYVIDESRKRRTEPLVKTPELIEKMRKAGKLAAETLNYAASLLEVGVTTEEVDAKTHQFIIDNGAYPSPLGYSGYPKSLCASVNEVICHGIPDDRKLMDGDICDLDITVYLDGVHGDTNATYFVGNVDEASRKLVKITEECMYKGIEAVKPGQPMNAIGKAIQKHAESNGYGVVRAFVGHGIGEVFHNQLHILHYFDPQDKMQMEEGMTFTIEPMITMGSWRHRMWDDDWTAVTADLQRTAQFEHTLVVTSNGAEVLTKL